MNNFTIRASSLGGLFNCPASWAATHIDGKRTPSNSKSLLGKAIHASTAVYDIASMDGTGITIDESAGAAVDAICKPDEPVIYDEMGPRELSAIAISLHMKYCRVIAPQMDYVAVEVQCDALEITDLGLTLTGQVDRIRRTASGHGINDIKTGKAAVDADGTVKTAGHAYQMGVYELLAEHASGLSITDPAQILAMTTAKTPGSQRIGIGEIVGARDVLLGDGETPGILEHASRIIHSGNFWGNPKSMMCHKDYCAAFSTCKFRL